MQYNESFAYIYSFGNKSNIDQRQLLDEYARAGSCVQARFTFAPYHLIESSNIDW